MLLYQTIGLGFNIGGGRARWEDSINTRRLLNTGDSRNMESKSKVVATDTSGLSFVLHPLPLLNISDFYTRGESRGQKHCKKADKHMRMRTNEA
jgi:hypothetical protein